MSRTPFVPALLGTAALVALPALAVAQTTGSTPQSPPSTAAQPTTQEPSGSPEHHIDLAKQALDRIERSDITGPKESKLNELRRAIDALDRSYGRSTESGEDRPGQAGAGDNWNTHLAAANKALDGLLGRGPTGTTGSTSTGTETTGTSGRASSQPLDTGVRAQLEEVRRHLTNFAAAASGVGASGSTSQRPTDPRTTHPTTGTPPTSATGTTGSSTSSTSGTTGSTMPSTPTTQEPPTSTSGSQSQTTGTTTTGQQVSVEVAREHLTRARQSLADITAMPQAQQLQGEPRNRVSQLISQFNTLITTRENWRESYDQVEQTLNSLLSMPSGAATSAETGSTGTTGTTGGQETLDPAIRSKLEEFQTHLKAFFTAAGGEQGGGTSAGTTAGSAATTAAPEVESHIAAIEQIVNEALGASTSSPGTTTGTTGTAGSTTAPSTVTIDRAKLEEIQMHLQRLREGIK